jgi:hypothetical protein
VSRDVSEKRDKYIVSVGKPNGKRPLGRCKPRPKYVSCYSKTNVE